MNSNEEWTDDILRSMEGSRRAKPRPELLKKIQASLSGHSTPVIQLVPWRSALVASALLLLINITAVYTYVQSNKKPSNQNLLAEAYSESLISSFQFYKL